MESKSKKHCGSAKRTRRDRLSELPDEVLVNILSFLPTLDAVRTVLLRRFGNLWTLVDSLSFSDRLFGNHPDANKVNPAAASLFSEFVRNVLILHRRHTVRKFHIAIYEGSAEMAIWIRFALCREVEELTVDIYCWDRESHALPHCVFNSQSLVSLELIGCIIKKQTRVHMGSLRKLTFDQVKVGGETFKEIISGCPSLEELVITCNSKRLWVTSANIKSLKLTGWETVTIDCPNLKILYICASVHNVEIIDVSSVSEAEIDLCGPRIENSAPTFLSVLEKIGNAEVMELAYSSFANLVYCSIKELVFPCNKWKRLIVRSWMHGNSISAICKLLRKSLCLEDLTIYADQLHGNLTMKKTDVDLLTKELSSSYVLPQLKIVTMHGYPNPYGDQLQLAELLLRSAPNLDKLLFVRDEEDELTPEEELEFVMQVASFQRASANARVVFENYENY